MASAQNTSILPNSNANNDAELLASALASSAQVMSEHPERTEFLELMAVATKRASEAMESGADVRCRYPLLWVYAAVEGKSWDQVRDDAADRMIRSMTTREMDCYLESTDTTLKYRSIFESFSKHLWCKWLGLGSPRRHTWTKLELSLVCPENDEAIRKADFRERLDDEIAYLDFAIQ